MDWNNTQLISHSSIGHEKLSLAGCSTRLKSRCQPRPVLIWRLKWGRIYLLLLYSVARFRSLSNIKLRASVSCWLPMAAALTSLLVVAWRLPSVPCLMHHPNMVPYFIKASKEKSFLEKWTLQSYMA